MSNTGVVTAKAAGSATITVKTADGGKTATCAVTVKTNVPGTVDKAKFTSIGVDSLTATDGNVYANVNFPSNSSSVGLYFGTSALNLTKRASENTGSKVLKINYPLNKWGITLTANTDYYYQFYAVINGATYLSEIGHFKTPSAATGKYQRIEALPVPRVAQRETADGGQGSDCYVCATASVQAYHQGKTQYTYGSYSATYSGTGGLDYDWSKDPFWHQIYTLNGNSVYMLNSTFTKLPYPMEGDSYAVSSGAKNALPFAYNCLKAGKPVAMHYSNGSAMHASVIIGYKGNNATTLDADDFIVMEIKKVKWGNGYAFINNQTNFNNCMNTPITRSNYQGSTNCTCYMTLAAWMRRCFGTEDIILNMRWKK